MNPTDLEQGRNTGVVIDIKPTDFVFGAESAIEFESRLAAADWEKFKSTDEWQRRNVAGKLGYDTNTCVTFSMLNSVEAQVEYLLERGYFTKEQKDLMEELGWFDEKGKVNFNEWFSANLNGTTPDGNNLQAPWDSARKVGLLGQKHGPQVNDFKTIEEWFAGEPTQAQKDLAKRALELIEIRYEWTLVGTSGLWDVTRKQLEHAPLHIASHTCNGWNTKDGIVPICPGVTRCNHATLYIGQEKRKSHKILDHYTPFVKALAWDYYIPYAVKGVVSVAKPKPVEPPFTYQFHVQLRYGMGATDEVKMLQKALQYLKGVDGKPYMTPGVFGIYGPITKTALGKFQTENGITDPDGQGMNFGPKTRSAMNAKLKTA